MAILQPITKEREQQDIRDQEDRQKKERAFLKQEKNPMPVANDAQYGRPAANDADFDEAQEPRLLQETQRRAMILQEDEEAEMDSITGEVKSKNESVKLSSYAGPFLVAIFKDMLDFTILLALPGLATVLAFCAEALIVFLLFFPKRKYRISTNTKLVIKDFSILSVTFSVEGLAFPLNILPFMTGGVAIIWLLDSAFVTARNAKKSAKKKPSFAA